jgi:hypothetical protein
MIDDPALSWRERNYCKEQRVGRGTPLMLKMEVRSAMILLTDGLELALLY